MSGYQEWSAEQIKGTILSIDNSRFEALFAQSEFAQGQTESARAGVTSASSQFPNNFEGEAAAAAYEKAEGAAKQAKETGTNAKRTNIAAGAFAKRVASVKAEVASMDAPPPVNYWAAMAKQGPLVVLNPGLASYNVAVQIANYEAARQRLAAKAVSLDVAAIWTAPVMPSDDGIYEPPLPPPPPTLAPPPGGGSSVPATGGGGWRLPGSTGPVGDTSPPGTGTLPDPRYSPIVVNPKPGPGPGDWGGVIKPPVIDDPGDSDIIIKPPDTGDPGRPGPDPSDPRGPNGPDDPHGPGDGSTPGEGGDGTGIGDSDSGSLLPGGVGGLAAAGGLAGLVAGGAAAAKLAGRAGLGGLGGAAGAGSGSLSNLGSAAARAASSSVLGQGAAAAEAAAGSAGAAARPGAGTSPMMGGPGAGAGAGKRGSIGKRGLLGRGARKRDKDDEIERADYLVEDDDTWGATPTTGEGN